MRASVPFGIPGTDSEAGFPGLIACTDRSRSSPFSLRFLNSKEGNGMGRPLLALIIFFGAVVATALLTR